MVEGPSSRLVPFLNVTDVPSSTSTVYITRDPHTGGSSLHQIMQHTWQCCMAMWVHAMYHTIVPKSKQGKHVKEN